MSIVPYGFISPVVRDFRPVDTAGIVPMTATSVISEPFAVRQGKPDVPDIWIEATTALEGDGSAYTDRLAITDINDDCLVRYAPTDATWDATAFTWDPYVTNTGARYQLTASPLSAPQMTEVDYQLGKEIFTANVMDFDIGSVLTSASDVTADQLSSFAISLALTVQSVSLTPITLIGGGTLSFTSSQVIVRLGGYTLPITMKRGELAKSPVYVVWDVTPTKMVLTGATRPSELTQGSAAVKLDPVDLTMTMSGAFDLFGLDLWGPERPSAKTIVARYASVLGAQ